MKERYVISERGKTYYWISKSKNEDNKVLVFLHGLTADHRLFNQQVKAFREDYTIIVWDAPGHGKSRPYPEFSYKNLAEELKQILDVESVEKAVLIGQSMGGFVAQSFISKYPEMVEGFVAIDTCPYGTDYYSKSDFFWLRQIEWMANCFPDGLLRLSMAKMCGATKYTQKNMLRMHENYSKKELCHLMYQGFAGFIPEVHDLKIKCPVCLILGQHDYTGKVRQYNKQWHAKENIRCM